MAGPCCLPRPLVNKEHASCNNTSDVGSYGKQTWLIWNVLKLPVADPHQARGRGARGQLGPRDLYPRQGHAQHPGLALARELDSRRRRYGRGRRSSPVWHSQPAVHHGCGEAEAESMLGEERERTLGTRGFSRQSWTDGTAFPLPMTRVDGKCESFERQKKRRSVASLERVTNKCYQILPSRVCTILTIALPAIFVVTASRPPPFLFPPVSSPSLLRPLH